MFTLRCVNILPLACVYLAEKSETGFESGRVPSRPPAKGDPPRGGRSGNRLAVGARARSMDTQGNSCCALKTNFTANARLRRRLRGPLLLRTTNRAGTSLKIFFTLFLLWPSIISGRKHFLTSMLSWFS